MRYFGRLGELKVLGLCSLIRGKRGSRLRILESCDKYSSGSSCGRRKKMLPGEPKKKKKKKKKKCA